MGGLQQAAAMTGATAATGAVQGSQSLPNLTSLTNPAQQVPSQQATAAAAAAAAFMPKLTAPPQLHLSQQQTPQQGGAHSASIGTAPTNIPPSTSN